MASKRQKKKRTRKKQADVVSVGVDLGTSRSVVCASSGAREMVESYVGWPKDFVAAKMLGKPVLFGADALEHRLSLELVRPLANGVIKEGTERDEEAVMELVGHLVSLADAARGSSIHAAVGVPAAALRVNKEAIRNAISKFADKLIVMSEPFAVAYGMNLLDGAMIVDIGAGTVDFCIMHGTMPSDSDQRSLVTAGDYVDQQLLGLLSENYPDSHFTLNMVRQFKEEYGYVGSARRKILVEAPVDGKLMSHDITAEIGKACESILPAIVETANDLIGKFDPEFQAAVRENVVLAGGGSQIAGIAKALEDSLNEFAPSKVSAVKDPIYAGADGALALAKDMPPEYWQDI